MKNLLNVKGATLLSKQEQKEVYGGIGGVPIAGLDCTVSCQDGHRVDTESCSNGTAETACQGHGGPQGCAGAASSCAG